MSFSLGIVGLPNVGKSTLFNALTNLQVEAANYPFATIEPNVGVVPVPDERLAQLAALEKSAKIVPAVVEFHDIAGLVKGASKGEGLGNQFLAHIREVDAIVEVVRFFEDPNVIHVAGKVDPQSDIDTIATELTLADLQLVEKKLETLKRAAKGGQSEDITKAALAQKYYDALAAGKPAKTVTPTEEEAKYLHEFPLLTRKPTLLVANIKQNSPSPLSPPTGGEGNGGGQREGGPLRRSEGEARGEFLFLDAQIESEIAQLPAADRPAYLKELGLSESGLDKLIRAAYEILGLITFFTAGPMEARAWTCPKGALAPAAAGVIHTDFEKGFIKAEVINWKVLLECGGYAAARDKGLLQQEGREYYIQDGDVVHFKFNV